MNDSNKPPDATKIHSNQQVSYNMEEFSRIASFDILSSVYLQTNDFELHSKSSTQQNSLIASCQVTISTN